MRISTDPQTPLDDNVQAMRTCAELSENALRTAGDGRGRVQQTLPLTSPSRQGEQSSSTGPWPSGTVLGVSFIGGTEGMRERVKQYANIWTEHANIHFDFDAPHPATIRIAFVDEAGSWSILGRLCEQVPEVMPTMNLAWLNSQSPDGLFAGTVLHEFGHALGLVHEHLPSTRINWNKGAVYAYFERTQGWSRDDVDRNVFKHYERVLPQIRAAAFDPHSIMLYPIPSQFTFGQSIGWNVQLSDTNKQRIRNMYPGPPVFFDAGTFNTTSIRSHEPALDNKGTIRFTVALDARRTAPRVLLGMNWADMERWHNVRLSCDVLSIGPDSAQINLRSWEDTVQYSSGCSWLAISPNDKDSQSGTYSAAEDWRYGWLPPHTSHRVQFARSYAAIPKVAVWLSAIDCHSNRHLRFSVFATDVTTTGFTLHLDTWADTELYLLTATWFAHSADRTDVFSGMIDPTIDMPLVNPKPTFSGFTSFDGARFAKPPRVFMAFSQLDAGNEANLRVRVSASDISARGLQYLIEARDDSIMFSARCAFVAIA